MAILALITHPEITKSHYEAVRKEVKWESHFPEGAVLHVAGFGEKGGLHVVDVWESKDALDKFFKDRLGPALQKLKVPQPAVEVYPVHNANAFAAMDRFKVKGR